MRKMTVIEGEKDGRLIAAGRRHRAEIPGLTRSFGLYCSLSQNFNTKSTQDSTCPEFDSEPANLPQPASLPLLQRLIIYFSPFIQEDLGVGKSAGACWLAQAGVPSFVFGTIHSSLSH